MEESVLCLFLVAIWCGLAALVHQACSRERGKCGFVCPESEPKINYAAQVRMHHAQYYCIEACT